MNNVPLFRQGVLCHRVWSTYVVATYNNLNNIKYYTDKDSLRSINQMWNEKKKRRWGHGAITSIVVLSMLEMDL
jgi:hypothetical protein